MAVFIKVLSDGHHVILGGQVATEEMLADGYFEFEGEVPPRSRMDCLRYDAETKTLTEDLDERKELELIQIRKKRDDEIAKSDWRAAKAAETGVPLSAAWVNYRQALRDITNGYVAATEIDWPVAPDFTPPPPPPGWVEPTNKKDLEIPR
jgi:hypothetical protein